MSQAILWEIYIVKYYWFCIIFSLSHVNLDSKSPFSSCMSPQVSLPPSPLCPNQGDKGPAVSRKKKKLEVTWVPYLAVRRGIFSRDKSCGGKKFFFAPFLFSSNQRSRRRKDFRALFPGRKTKGATFFGTLNRPVPLQFFKVFREKVAVIVAAPPSSIDEPSSSSSDSILFSVLICRGNLAQGNNGKRMGRRRRIELGTFKQFWQKKKTK